MLEKQRPQGTDLAFRLLGSIQTLESGQCPIVSTVFWPVFCAQYTRMSWVKDSAPLWLFLRSYPFLFSLQGLMERLSLYDCSSLRQTVFFVTLGYMNKNSTSVKSVLIFKASTCNHNSNMKTSSDIF